ncbi:hypothetical protein AVEN_104746-1 [Araneus ventricosus]|uniref:Uncharacterized protein n=1 Tax=Araneus ventricosus TaxID=182803 RepID=A0A4Y2RR25_ARAVE|nr:hypothetical protein AVEN_104746-1 [Araneus ventricosus]
MEIALLQRKMKDPHSSRAAFVSSIGRVNASTMDRDKGPHLTLCRDRKGHPRTKTQILSLHSARCGADKNLQRARTRWEKTYDQWWKIGGGSGSETRSFELMLPQFLQARFQSSRIPLYFTRQELVFKFSGL